MKPDLSQPFTWIKTAVLAAFLLQFNTLAGYANPQDGDYLLRTLAGHEGAVNSVAFGPSGLFALSAGSDQTIRMWNTFRGHESRKLVAYDNVLTVAFSVDGVHVISGGGRDNTTLLLWDIKSTELLRTYFGHSDAVYSVDISSDGLYMISGSGDDTVKLWYIDTGYEMHTFRAHDDDVLSVAFSPDGSQFLSASRDNTLKLWDFYNGQEIHMFTGHTNGDPSMLDSMSGMNIRYNEAGEAEVSGVNSVAFSPDGNFVLSGSVDATMKIWDTETGDEIRTIQVGSIVWTVDYSPNGIHILSGDENGDVILWDVNTGEMVRIFEGHETRVLSVAFDPAGERALSGDMDGVILLWDLGLVGEAGE